VCVAILCDAATMEACLLESRLSFTPLAGRVHMKGKERSIAAYRPTCQHTQIVLDIERKVRYSSSTFSFNLYYFLRFFSLILIICNHYYVFSNTF